MGLFDEEETDDDDDRVVLVDDAVFDRVLAILAARSRWRAGGKGTGGAAGFVFSYRRATRLVSSRNDGLPKPDRLFWRTEENLVGSMVGLSLELSSCCSCSRLTMIISAWAPDGGVPVTPAGSTGGGTNSKTGRDEMSEHCLHRSGSGPAARARGRVFRANRRLQERQ